MKYCPQCGAEYQDTVTECSDCDVPLISEAEMRRRGLPLPEEDDQRAFVRADTAEDPLTAERLVSVLKNANIEAFSRAQFGGTVDKISGPGGPWWEILVLESDLTKATELLREERVRMDADADDASRAAEEEAERSTLDPTT